VAQTHIIVMAKAPIAGRVKTRLAPLLGDAGALALHRQLIESTLFRARDAALGAVTLWVDGDTTLPEIATCAMRQRVGLQAQQGADLGARMQAAFAHTFAHAFANAPASDRRCLLIGSDCPALTSMTLRAAAAALERHDAVLVPALDGGYVLLGLTRPQPTLFDGVAWGTDRVLAETRARMTGAGLSRAELDPLPDLDTPDDYRAALAAGWIAA
jgi:uncharacterized protein